MMIAKLKKLYCLSNNINLICAYILRYDNEYCFDINLCLNVLRINTLNVNYAIQNIIVEEDKHSLYLYTKFLVIYVSLPLNCAYLLKESSCQV